MCVTLAQAKPVSINILFLSPRTNEEFWSWIFVWQRFSFQQLLTWERNTCTQPRMLAATTNQITQRLATWSTTQFTAQDFCKHGYISLTSLLAQWLLPLIYQWLSTYHDILVSCPSSLSHRLVASQMFCAETIIYWMQFIMKEIASQPMYRFNLWDIRHNDLDHKRSWNSGHQSQHP